MPPKDAPNKLLVPMQADHSKIRCSDQPAKEWHKSTYDKHHTARPLAPLQPGQPVTVDVAWRKEVGEARDGAGR